MTTVERSLREAIHVPYSERRPGTAGREPYVGDLYDPEASFAQMASSLTELLRGSHPGETVRITRRVYAMGRTLEVSIVTSDRDLSDAEIRKGVCLSISDQAERLGYDRSAYEVDLVDRHFALDVEVAADYWSARQAASGIDPVESDMSPATFMKAMKSGHRLRELSGDRRGRTYVVKSSSPSRFITDDGAGGIHDISWKVPRAMALRTDGRLIRIAMGTQNKPDEHKLLEWIR
jgi:hypothetical protein